MDLRLHLPSASNLSLVEAVQGALSDDLRGADWRHHPNLMDQNPTNAAHRLWCRFYFDGRCDCDRRSEI